MLDVYDEYPNHHFPPHRWNPQINDTEVAHVTAPWKDCCDKDEDCVCVTEEDVNLWNNISSLSGLTGIDWENISSYSAIESSATLWNDTYNTVSSNSAYWNGISALDELSGLSASANWEDTYQTVSSNSAKWNNAVHYSGYIEDNASAISALSAEFAKNIKIYFDGMTITGDGSQNAPYSVKNYNEFIKLLNAAFNGYRQLYNNDGTQKWMSLSATTDSDGINPYLKTLLNAINKKDNDQDIALTNHGDLIQWIIKNLDITGKKMHWEYVPETVTSNKDAVASLTEENTLYYYAKPVTDY